MTNEEMIAQIKNLLGITSETSEVDSMLDTNLNWIVSSSKQRLKVLLGGVEPPEDLEHIIIEVSVIRFNRIGSEGLQTHSVKDESMSFAESDFAGFMDEIEAWLDEQKDAKRGRVRFI